MLEVTWIIIIGAVVFYILRVLFNLSEFNVLSVILSVCGMATVLTDTTIAGDQLAYFLIPLFFVIAMGIIHFGDNRWSL